MRTSRPTSSSQGGIGGTHPHTHILCSTQPWLCTCKIAHICTSCTTGVQQRGLFEFGPLMAHAWITIHSALWRGHTHRRLQAVKCVLQLQSGTQVD